MNRSAKIQMGKLGNVKAALAKRGDWGDYIGEFLHEGVNDDLTGEMLDTLADVAGEVDGLEVAS